MTRHLLPALLLCAAVSLTAEPLPSPLHLSQALQIATHQQQPGLQLARSRLEQAKAGLLGVESDSGLQIKAVGRLEAVDPSDISPDDSNDNSSAHLLLEKKLYDFGYSNALEAAAAGDVTVRDLELARSRQQQLLDTLQAYTEVLVADKEYVLVNERMTLAFLQWDKARDRHELGTVSDIELLALENDYRQLLQARRVSEAQQRLTRTTLAVALNSPDDLPSRLVEPEVQWDIQMPAIETVTERALQANLELLAAREAVNAANRRLQAAQAADNPVLRGEMSLNDYQRQTGSTHKATAGIVLEVPLYTGGRSASAIAAARARLAEAQAHLRQTELDVRESATRLVFELETLKSQLQALKVSENYGELYLDKNRALYELEVASDFGDAVVRVSEVIYQQIRSRMDFLQALAKLAILQGDDVMALFSKTAMDNSQ